MRKHKIGGNGNVRFRLQKGKRIKYDNNMVYQHRGYYCNVTIIKPKAKCKIIFNKIAWYNAKIR